MALCRVCLCLSGKRALVAALCCVEKCLGCIVFRGYGSTAACCAHSTVTQYHIEERGVNRVFDCTTLYLKT